MDGVNPTEHQDQFHTNFEEEEPIVRFAHHYQHAHQAAPANLFVCGHIHCAELFPLQEGGEIAFLGEWIEHPTYGQLSPEGFQLKKYPAEHTADKH